MRESLGPQHGVHACAHACLRAYTHTHMYACMHTGEALGRRHVVVRLQGAAARRKLQRAARRRLCRIERAVVALQSARRGALARRDSALLADLRREFRQRSRSAVIIQTWARGGVARRALTLIRMRYVLLSSAAVVVQRAVRPALVRMARWGSKAAREEHARRMDHAKAKLGVLEAQLAAKGLTEAKRAGLVRMVATQRYQLRRISVVPGHEANSHQPWAPCDPPYAHQPWAPCDPPYAHQPWAPCDPCLAGQA